MLFYDEDLHIFYSRSQVMASIVILFDLLLIAICILKSAAFTKMMYRMFNKEGQKVLGYKTNKNVFFEVINKLIASQSMGHFEIQSTFIKNGYYIGDKKSNDKDNKMSNIF